MNYLNGTEEPSTFEKKTQTFLATHDGAGNRLPLMNRSFLSFSYGGKFIEDFQLIVTYTQYVNKGIYSEFEDSVSGYTTMDGEYYWGTRMASNIISFTLSTDYMTQNMLDEFKFWFRPGVERDLILAEHPNRYARARVSTTPQMSMTPFGEPVKIKIQKYNENDDTVNEYETMTTVYRGSIEIEFTISEPFWTGILNYMPYTAFNMNQLADDRIKLLLNQIITNNSLTSADALKICLEDGIPHDLTLYGDLEYLLGITKGYTNIILSRTPLAIENELINDENYDPSQYINLPNTSAYSRFPSDEWAATQNSNQIGSSMLSILPPGAYTDIAETDSESARIYDYVLNNTEGLIVTSEQPQYLFYSGTAPSKPIVKFTLELSFNDAGYIIHPFNKITSGDNYIEKSYIAIGKNKFEFTTPGICTGYNKALELLDEIKEEATIFELLKEYREKIKNKYIRKWAIYCLKDYNQQEYVSNNIENIRGDLQKFFKPQLKFDYDYENLTRTQIIYYTMDFEFNSKTGGAIGIVNCRTPQKPIEGEQITENVGDMVLSNYLIIDERNYLNDKGIVVIDNCTPITTNENISNLIILYNNMYY